MRNIAIIQARMSSSRLPNKVMLDLCGKPVLQRVYERVAQSKYIDKIIIATTINKNDDIISLFCHKNYFPYFRGSENNVLERYYKCALLYNLNDDDNIIRVTSDCPVIDPQIIDMVIEKHVKENNDLTSNAITESFPDGVDIEIFKFYALKESYKNAILPSHIEHVTMYIKDFDKKFKIGELISEINYNDYRWTLDTIDDYRLLYEIYDFFHDDIFFMDDILRVIKKFPDLKDINKDIIRNEGLIKSREQDALYEYIQTK